MAEAQAVQARLDAQFGLDRTPIAHDAPTLSPVAVPDAIQLAVYEDMATVEQDWRRFEPHADCTVFQTFDWLACWQRHIGVLSATRPAIVVGRDAAGNVLFILPLAIRATGFGCELVWLGSDLCDYNAPLLAATFSERFGRDGFMPVWEAITRSLQSHPQLRYDLVDLTKMPETIGAQPNPMLQLPVTMHPSGAYLTHLSDNWETFYAAKRSSATRRRDRTKRKRLAEFGEVRLINPQSDDDTLGTLDTLMAQKARSFAHMGVSNLFAKPGYAAFYRALATDPATRHLVHVSRIDVGGTAAAVNLGLTYRDRYYHLLASYDDGEVSRFGPGAAHLHDLLRQAIERGFHIFDFTIGDERYKRDWCDNELKLYDYIAAANWRGTLVAAPMHAALWLKRQIKQTPALWNAFSAGRALIGSWARHLRR